MLKCLKQFDEFSHRDKWEDLGEGHLDNFLS